MGRGQETVGDQRELPPFSLAQGGCSQGVPSPSSIYRTMMDGHTPPGGDLVEVPGFLRTVK